MSLYVTPIVASVLALIYIFLSFYVIQLRRKYSLGIDDGGKDDLTRRIRMHANFSEYVPLALILLLITEINSASDWVLIGCGVLLVAGRVSHAYGLGAAELRDKPVLIFRMAGMIMTFISIITLAVTNIIASF